jgi:signal transduction histidine kinase
MSAELDAEPTHEDVSRAAARAAGALTDARPLLFFHRSTTRQIMIVTRLGREGDTQTQSLPLPSGDLEPAHAAADGHKAAALLPRDMADQFAGLLGAAPCCCCPVRRREEFLGGIVLADPAPAGWEESFHTFSDFAGGWLSAAEASAAARGLNEELVDINRRLIASQGELTRMRSLAMVGEMAAGAAHELNNPLAIISGRAQMLARPDADAELQRSTAIIAENAQRASDLVAELMGFAKPAPPQTTDWPLRGLLDELRRRWSDSGEFPAERFEIFLSDDSVQIRADFPQIRTLFDELIRNAAQALRAAERPLLTVNCKGHVADERVVIEVVDNGIGMTPDIAERAFTPFFSHRPAGRGRGMGLSRAARFAEINGGRIRLASRPGEGTCVTVELPGAARG